MKISEIFFSIQGEGTRIGLPTVFVRLFACDLRCSWCDTMYAVEGRDYTDLKVDDILSRIKEFSCKSVCITGGEPLIQRKEVSGLAEILVNHGYKIVLETSGHKDPPDIFLDSNCCISMDCKCPSSGMHDKMDFSLLSKLGSKDQLKFVIADDKDFEYAKNILSRYNVNAPVIFQPVYGNRIEWLTDAVLKNSLDHVRVLPQLHKIIWGEKRGV